MRITNRLAALAATVAAVAVASPSVAAPVSATASAEARGLVLQPLTLTKSSDLDFGTVIASNAAGTVSIDADDGSRNTTGGVTGVGSALGGRAVFNGAGTAGAVVSLTLSQPGQLWAANGVDYINATLSLDSGGTSRTILPSGAFAVGVGGDFDIAASQANGLYSAQFDLTADYP